MPLFGKRTPSIIRHARAGKALAYSRGVQWYGDRVLRHITTTMGHRVRIATEHLRAKTVANIRTPVGVSYSAAGEEEVIERSKPGEFPRQETGRLMKSISVRIHKKGLEWRGDIQSSAPYAPYLESESILNRVFLRRTLLEELPRIRRILAGPIR